MDSTPITPEDIKQRNIIHQLFSSLENDDFNEFQHQVRLLATLRGEQPTRIYFAFLKHLNTENMRLIHNRTRDAQSEVQNDSDD